MAETVPLLLRLAPTRPDRSAQGPHPQHPLSDGNGISSLLSKVGGPVGLGQAREGTITPP